MNEFACSKEEKTQKEGEKGREERMKINGRQVLGVMHTTVMQNVPILCEGKEKSTVDETKPDQKVRSGFHRHCKSIKHMTSK